MKNRLKIYQILYIFYVYSIKYSYAYLLLYYSHIPVFSNNKKVINLFIFWILSLITTLFFNNHSSTIFNTRKRAFYKVCKVYPQIFQDCIQFNQQVTVDNFFVHIVEIPTFKLCQDKFYQQLSTVLFKNPVKSTLSRFFVKNLSKNKQILPKSQQDCK